MPMTDADAESGTGGWLWTHSKIPMRWSDHAVTASGTKRFLPHAGERVTLRCRLCGGDRSSEDEVIGEGAVPFRDGVWCVARASRVSWRREGCSAREVGSSSAPGGPSRKRALGTPECPNCVYWDKEKAATPGEPRSLSCAEAHQCMFHVVDTFITWRPDAHASKEGFNPRDGVQRVAYHSDDDVVSQTDSASSDDLSWDSASENDEVK